MSPTAEVCPAQNSDLNWNLCSGGWCLLAPACGEPAGCRACVPLVHQAAASPRGNLELKLQPLCMSSTRMLAAFWMRTFQNMKERDWKCYPNRMDFSLEEASKAGLACNKIHKKGAAWWKTAARGTGTCMQVTGGSTIEQHLAMASSPLLPMVAPSQPETSLGCGTRASWAPTWPQLPVPWAMCPFCPC